MRRVQAEEGPGVWREFEWLATSLVKRMGGGGNFDGITTGASFAERAPILIATLQRQVDDLEALRSVPSAPATSRRRPAAR